MGIDMTNYKMIYEDKVYNCLNLCPIFGERINDCIETPERLAVIFIDEDNRIKSIEDKADKFQFVRR